MVTASPSAPAPSPALALSSRAAGIAGLTVALVAGALSVGLALLVTSGGPILVAQPGSGAIQEVGPTTVLLATLVPVALGAVALAAVGRGRPNRWSALAWLGAAVGLLTAPMPVVAAEQLGDGLALAAMHVIAGLTWLVVIRGAIRSRS